ncbi:MAG: hypothetical protein PHC57_07210 [Candidatus Cloacimonetes bacterium]|nr:hypothetical protein [Candidatus Cloacimonadota bacterium]
MKRILSVLVICLLISCKLLWSQNQEVEFYYFNSDNSRILESLLNYQIQPQAKSFLNVHGQSAWEERLNFNQEVRRSLIGASFGYQLPYSLHSVFMDYESYYDASDLDPTAYINKNGNLGYRLFLSPLDSLSFQVEARGVIRNEQDRYLPGNHIKSKGLHLLGAMNYHPFRDLIDASVSANMEHRKLDWEAYQLASANLNFSWMSEYLDWENRFTLSGRQDQIYNLLSNETKQDSYYQKLDTQTRSTLDIYSQLSYYPASNMEVYLSENYAERRTSLEENLIRNNGEFFNQLNLDISYLIVPDLTMITKASHAYTIKDFSYAENTRHLENRALSTNLAWEYAEYDSLMLYMGIELQKTMFPKNKTNKWDNDLRSRNSRFGWKHYFRDSVRLSNWLSYSIREDVYIDSLLSTSNHDLRSLSYTPQIDLLLGDRLCLEQSYQIRADYTDYFFGESNQDKLYRQLGYRYNLIFDSYPYVARAGDDKWFQLPYRANHGSAFMAELTFAYEENQYAQQMERYYQINTKNRRYQASLNIRHDIGEFYYSIKPQYIWGTWKEYSVIAGFNWRFNNKSYLEFTLTPIAEELSSIDWRSSVNLNLRF